MITFHKKYFALDGLPGYYWNKEDEKLYSIKIGGVLRPLALQKPNSFNHLCDHGYQLSKHNRSYSYTIRQIKSKIVENYIIQ